MLMEAAKKGSFASGPTTITMTNSGYPFVGISFRASKKVFFLSGPAFIPPP